MTKLVFAQYPRIFEIFSLENSYVYPLLVTTCRMAGKFRHGTYWVGFYNILKLDHSHLYHEVLAHKLMPEFLNP